MLLPFRLFDSSASSSSQTLLGVIVRLLRVLRRSMLAGMLGIVARQKSQRIGRAKMRSMLVLLTLLCATKAFAADQYQIIPLYSLAIQGRPQVHGALIINEANGDNYTCSAFVHQEMPISFDSIECSKAVNKVGTMPPGPAALSPFAHQTAAPYPAIWKIDQTKGTLTFCAATEVPAGGWLCGSSKLP